ncbi:MAG: tRNA-intron lyase [Thermoplasmatota archaeon]
MAGLVKGDKVVVEDPGEASRIHNRGWFGTPQPGGGLALELVEALFLLETGRLEVSRGGERADPELLTRYAVVRQRGFETKYAVYADMRRRGLTVKPFAPSPPDFTLYERGAVPSRSMSRHYVLALSESAPFDLDGTKNFLERSSSLGKGTIFALVDEEGDLTYYEASLHRPRGELPEGGPAARGRAIVLDERVLVFDEELAGSLRARHYGRSSGGALQLSLIEAASLAEDGLLELYSAGSGRRVSRGGLVKRAGSRRRDFELRLRVYRSLRGLGLVVRTGFKYGAHFRAYDSSPEGTHARYLLHALPGGFVGSWPDISRAVRLAHGVRKEMLIARVGPCGDPDYIKLSRARP